jgi:DHA1 family bicyclomycin/chloramphenicol resistance-like MFS transporter
MRQPAPADRFTPARRFELIFLFGLLTVFTPIAIDMYLPALPGIARQFHVSVAAIEHSLAAYFLGLAVGQAAIGPLSDRYGRRRPLCIGLALYVLGSVACALARDPLTLNIARFVQATGGCAGTVLARACVRDLFAPEEAARIFAQMLLILSVSPLFAPLFGGWLLLVTGWRSLFWIQAGAALATLAAIAVRLPESHAGAARTLHPFAVAKDYLVIAADRRFIGYILSLTLSGCGLYVFLTGFPHVVIDIFRIPAQYFGFLFMLNGIGLIVSSQATAHLLHHRPAGRLLRAALLAQASAGIGALLFAVTGWGGIAGLEPWLFVFCSLIGAINPTSAGLALAGYGHAAGMASALMGLFIYAGGTVASLLMGAFQPATPVPMAALMCLFGAGGLLTNLLFYPSRPKHPPHLP